MNTVTVMIRVKLDGKHPYLRAVWNENGRLKPNVAVVKEKEQKVRGPYYLRFTQDGRRRFKVLRVTQRSPLPPRRKRSWLSRPRQSESAWWKSPSANASDSPTRSPGTRRKSKSASDRAHIANHPVVLNRFEAHRVGQFRSEF
jgi:hypothetical protein